MKICKSIASLLLMLSFAAQAKADFQWDRSSATEKEKNAYACSAQLMIMSMGDMQEPEPELQNIATIGGMILSQLAAYETMERTGQDMTLGDVMSIREQEIEILMARFNIDANETFKESHFCLSWSASIIAAFDENNDITPEELFVPSKDSIPEPSLSQTYFMSSAYNNWRESGYIKPSAVKEALRRQLE